MTDLTYDPPWLSLPTEIGDVLAHTVPRVVVQIIQTIPRSVPTYARPLEGRFGDGVRRGTQVALDRFVTLPGTHRPALSPTDRHVYEDLGRGEVRNGRRLEALLAAYRSGARVTLREMSAAALEHGYGTEVLVGLGESVLAYIEELSAASAQGYAFEQSERAGQRDRLRVELLELLLSGRADEATVQQAAAAVAWVLPSHLVAVTMPGDRADGLRIRLGEQALVRIEQTYAVALVPAATGAAARRGLAAALLGRDAVVGPSRPWMLVADSLRLARLGASLQAPPGVPDEDAARPSEAVEVEVEASAPGATRAARSGRGHPLWVEDRLVDVVLAAESRAVADLGRRRLGPLAAVRPQTRERLAETLLAWLRHWGQRTPIAAELHVHPQTVGYRVAHLRRLFGEALDDPQARFELEVALRAGHR